MTVTSIYPIHQLYFKCNGCGAEWMLRAEPPIRNIEEFKSFTTDPNKMEPCPRNCGSRTCSIAFKISDPDAPPSTEPVDPFEIFKEK